jgi:hypothetical protein
MLTRNLAIVRVSLMAAVLLSGLLVGATVDRFVVQFPAWRQLGASAWADYSRLADLKNGVFLYPFEAVGSFLLLVVVCFASFSFTKEFRSFTLTVYFATGLAAFGLLFTFFAAPVMLSLRNGSNDAALLQNAFDRFYYWSFFRAIAQVLSFFCALFAMGALCLNGQPGTSGPAAT